MNKLTNLMSIVNSISSYFIPIFIAIIPLVLSFKTSDPVLSIRFLYISIVMTIFCVLQIFINKQIYRSIFNNLIIRLFLLIIIVYSFSFFYNGFSANSLYDLSKIVLFFIILVLIINNIKKYGYKYFIYSIIICSFILSSIYFIEYFFIYSHTLNFDALSSTMAHKNLLVSISFLSLPFLIYSIFRFKYFWRYISVISLIMVCVIFILIQSRAIILALAIFITSFFYVYRSYLIKIKNLKWLLLLICLVLGVFFVLNPDRQDTLSKKIQRTINFEESPRYNLFLSSINLIKDNPILGVGPGNWKIEIPKYGLYNNKNLEVQYIRGESFAQRPHSDILLFISEGGVIVGLSYIIIFILLIIKSYNLSRRNAEDSLLFALFFSTLLGYFFISLVDFPFERIIHNIVFNLISAIIILKSLNEKKDYFNNLFFFFFSILFFISIIGYVRHKGQISMLKIENYKKDQNWSKIVSEVKSSQNSLFFDLSNTSTPLHWYSGLANFNQNKTNNAFLDFKRAYEINPNHVHVINNLATCYELKGNTDKAINLYKKAIEIMPTFTQASVNLAAIYFNQKRYVNSLDVILSCRPPSYKERRLKNDNYDFYLKKIVNRYIEDIINSVDMRKKVKLNSIQNKFKDNPADASYIMEQVYNIRAAQSISYIDAIYLY